MPNTRRFLIRAAHPDDADRIAILAAQVWLHTYATEGVTQGIADHVRSEFTAQKYLERLSDAGTEVVVAEQDGGGLVGLAVVKLNMPCPADGGDAITELQTLYVQAHAIGQGVGKSLLRAAQAQADEQSGSALWLAVNARNDRAIAFYARQGYRRIGTSFFRLGGAVHENHVLVGPLLRANGPAAVAQRR